MKVSVKNFVIEPRFVMFEMEASSTVRDVKNRLHEQYGFPAPEVMIIAFQSQMFDDVETLNGTVNYSEDEHLTVIFHKMTNAPGGASSNRDTAGSDRLSGQESPDHATPLLSLVLELFQVLYLSRLVLQ